jgi:hypothetical protein
MIGTLRPGGIVQKTVRKANRLTTPPGWGLEIASLEYAESQGCHTIQLDEPESGLRYTMAVSTAWAVGIRRDLGFGLQLLIPFKYFSINGAPPTMGPAKPQPQPKPEASQLSFLASS